MVPRSRLGAAKNGTRPSLNLVTAFAYKHRSTATIATTMPFADYKTYCKMLDRARAGRFAFPAINVTSLTTANAVLRGLAERKRDRRARSSRRRALSDLRRAAHRPLLEGQARQVCPPARRGNRETARLGSAESFHRSHVRRKQSRVARKYRDFRQAARTLHEE